jgi:hypothetical protein
VTSEPTLGRRRVSRPTDPTEAERLVPALARWYLEFLAGLRPLSQVEELVTPAVAVRLGHRRQARCRAEGGTPDPTLAAATIGRVTLRWTSATRCEALVLVTHGERTTALTITLQRHPRRWRVVELASPEDGVPALRATPVPASTPDDHAHVAPARGST